MDAIPLKENRIRKRWRNSQVALGSLTLLPEPALAELMGVVGFDFMVADMEHAAADGRAIENMIRACQAVSMTALVRVRQVDEKTLLWVLDSGAEGVMIPMVDSPETARQAHQLTHYPPVGERTLCSATRAAGYGAYRSNFERFVGHVNTELVLVGLIETPQACDRIKEIALEGIDAFCVGRGDLSMKMGLHYDPGHQRVVDRTMRVLEVVINAGKVGGAFAYDLEDARRWIDFGCKLVFYSQPEIILATVYRQAYEALRDYADKLKSR